MSEWVTSMLSIMESNQRKVKKSSKSCDDFMKHRHLYKIATKISQDLLFILIQDWHRAKQGKCPSVLLIPFNKAFTEKTLVMQSQGTCPCFWACWHIDLLQAEPAWFALLHLSWAQSVAWDLHHNGTKPLTDTCFKGTRIKIIQLVGMRSLSNLWSFLS